MAIHVQLEVIDPVGLYATPVGELANIAKTYQSHVTLKYQQKEVNLKSMMGVLSLGIPTHALLEIIIDGPDEKQAKDNIMNKIHELGIAVER